MDNTLAVEQRSIDVIPDSERHGSVRSLFTVWFSANMQITTVVTGAVAGGLGLPRCSAARRWRAGGISPPRWPRSSSPLSGSCT